MSRGRVVSTALPVQQFIRDYRLWEWCPNCRSLLTSMDTDMRGVIDELRGEREDEFPCPSCFKPLRRLGLPKFPKPARPRNLSLTIVWDNGHRVSTFVPDSFLENLDDDQVLAVRRVTVEHMNSCLFQADVHGYVGRFTHPTSRKRWWRR